MATYFIFDGWEDLFVRAAISPDLSSLLSLDVAGSKADWFALTVLSALAFLMLPRQFQIAVVENVDERHLKRATWLFPAVSVADQHFCAAGALGGMLRFRRMSSIRTLCAYICRWQRAIPHSRCWPSLAACRRQPAW